jgi:hypothetical protein
MRYSCGSFLFSGKWQSCYGMALPPHSAEHLKISIKDDGCPDDPLVSCFNGLEDPQQAARRGICGCTRKDPQPLRDARIYTIMLVTSLWQKQISVEENSNDSQSFGRLEWFA